MSSSTGRAAMVGVLAPVAWTGCADKAPEPKWPEPPPPTLAEPLGQEEVAPPGDAEPTAAAEPAPEGEGEGEGEAGAETGAEAVPEPKPNEPEDGAVPIDR